MEPQIQSKGKEGTKLDDAEVRELYVSMKPAG
jgi:hypothetical protein